MAVPLSERYFRPKALELDGRLYECLGVVPFKRMLMGAFRVDPDRPTANAYVLAGRSISDVRAFERRSRRNEVVHVLGLAVGIGLLGLAAFTQAWAHWLPGLVLVFANLHCFMLQRYNRIRVYRLLAHAERRPGSAGAPSAAD